MPDTSWPGSIELGQRIAKARLAADISRQDLANLANTDVSNLSRIENGQGNPSFRTLVKIAASLDLDPGDLVQGIGAEMIPAADEVLSVREWAAAKRAEARKHPSPNP